MELVLKGFRTIGLQVEHYCVCEKHVVAPEGPVCVKPDKSSRNFTQASVVFFLFFKNGSMGMSAPLKHWWRYNSAALIGRAPGGGVRWGGVGCCKSGSTAFCARFPEFLCCEMSSNPDLKPTGCGY